MLIRFFEILNKLNELLFSPLDNLIEKMPFSDWVLDAICDSVHLLPFLFFIFLLIEIIEFYYADKINTKLKNSGKWSVLAGSVAAIFPQCGFSVMASSLYSNRIITRGCLIAIYLATSDETIPILLTSPEKVYLIIPIVAIKLFIAILAGYFIEFTTGKTLIEPKEVSGIEEGCCKHDIKDGSRRGIIIHPILHTMNIFIFILMITLVLNFCLERFEVTEFITSGRITGPLIASTVGLIPNCAISIGITLMLIKGTITFGTAMSGLLSNAGLGLLVLLKHNDFRDTLKIIALLLIISIVSGISMNFILN